MLWQYLSASKRLIHRTSSGKGGGKLDYLYKLDGNDNKVNVKIWYTGTGSTRI